MSLSSSSTSVRSDSIALALCLLLLSLYYVFVATAGTFATLSWNTDYYDQLAQGFRQGHFYLPTAPRPELLAFANPYDLAARELWMWDAVLFHKHFYLYWGPVPALCVWLFKLLTGWKGAVLDQWLALVFMLGRLYGGAALIWSLARFAGLRVRTWAMCLAIVVFAVASPTPFVLVRPLIYEASVGAGQCFVFWGLTAAFWGVLKPVWRTPLFVLAGTLWALALGSRVTISLVAPLLMAITLWSIARSEGYALRRLVRLAFVLGTPIALGLAGCAAYNYARFGSITEFGVTYQLTGRAFASESRFVLPNLMSYAFAELAVSCRFPFFGLPMYRHFYTTLIAWPADYDVGAYELGERVGGIFVTTAWSWLLALWLWRSGPVFRSAFRRVRHGSPKELSSVALWTLLCALSTVSAMLPALRMWTGSMRYLEDAAGGILIASTIAGFWLLQRTADSAQRWIRVLGRTLFVGLAIHSILIGVLLGFSGHTNNFANANPALYQKLVQSVSLCRAAGG